MKTIRSIPPALRLTLAIVVTAFFALIAWQNNIDITWVVAGTVGVFLVAEFWVFHRKFLVSLIPILLHLLFSTMYVSFIGLVLSQYETPSGFLWWTSAALLGIQVFVAGLYPFVALMLSQGRVWVNLVIAFLLYNATLITLTVYAGNLSFIMSAGIAAVVGLGWLVLRAFFPLERKTELSQAETVRGLPSTKQTTAFYDTLNRLSGGAEEVFEGVRFYPVGTSWWAVVATYVEDEVTLDETGFRIDGEDHSAALPALLHVVADFSQERKVRDTAILPAIVISPAQKLPVGVLATRVASARNPDRNLGTVTLLSADRAERRFRKEFAAALAGEPETD